MKIAFKDLAAFLGLKNTLKLFKNKKISIESTILHKSQIRNFQKAKIISSQTTMLCYSRKPKNKLEELLKINPCTM